MKIMKGLFYYISAGLLMVRRWFSPKESKPEIKRVRGWDVWKKNKKK